jgi:acyl-CoA hydrolase
LKPSATRVTIAAQHKMVAIAQAAAIDLTGQVCIDQFGGEFYGGWVARASFCAALRARPAASPLCA